MKCLITQFSTFLHNVLLSVVNILFHYFLFTPDAVQCVLHPALDGVVSLIGIISYGNLLFES
jgi:hypothetical protein